MGNRTAPNTPAAQTAQHHPAEPETLIHTSADRRLAIEHWLLSTLPEAGRTHARDEWNEFGVTVFPLGTLFSAVRLPAALVQAVAASRATEDIDAVLEETLGGGPVICDVRGERYYALVPASVPTTWQDAAGDWRKADVGVLGRGWYLGVPRMDATEPGLTDSYWSVPMPSMASLCTALSVARLIAAGVHRLNQAAEPDAVARAERATPALLPVTGPRRRDGR